MALNYQWPRECPLPGHGFDLCDGPASLGNADDYSARWAVWVATAGIRFGLRTDEVMDDELGDVNPHYTAGERPSHVTMTFNRDGQPIIAIQSDSVTVSVRYFVDDVSTEVTFEGKTPLLYNNQSALQAATPSDRACIYIKADGDQIFARFESEDFGTEHTINAGLNGNLRELLKTDSISITNTDDDSVHWFQALWAIRQDGKVVFFRSGEYLAATGTILAISGYSDTLFNPFSNPDDPSPVWDGTFPAYNLSHNIYFHSDNGFNVQIGGATVCQCRIQPVDGGWQMLIGNDVFDSIDVLWSGTLSGDSPIGTYVNSGNGQNPTDPPTYTIVQVSGTVIDSTRYGCSS